MNRNSSKRGRVSKCAVVSGMAAIGLLATAGARAANSPFTFAQFEQATQSTNANQFVYVDNGPTSDAEFTTQSNGVDGVSIPVIFTFLTLNSALAPDLQGPQQAMLTLTSSTTAAVQTANVFGETLGNQQVFGNGAAGDTLTITRDTPASEGSGARRDLLTMSFTGGLLGQLEASTPSLSGNSNSGNTVVYTSDFLTISPASANDFDMALSSWTTTSDGNGLEKSLIKGDSYFGSATSAGAATFDTSLTPVVTVVVPEAGIGSLVLGLGFVALTMRRRGAMRVVGARV